MTNATRTTPSLPGFWIVVVILLVSGAQPVVAAPASESPTEDQSCDDDAGIQAIADYLAGYCFGASLSLSDRLLFNGSTSTGIGWSSSTSSSQARADIIEAMVGALQTEGFFSHILQFSDAMVDYLDDDLGHSAALFPM